MIRQTVLVSAALLAFLAPEPAQAAGALDGTALRWPLALPFIGILLTIATGPLLFPHVWHRHYGKFALAWSVLMLAPLAAFHGTGAAVAAFAHEMLTEYLSFIVLLFALYVVAASWSPATCAARRWSIPLSSPSGPRSPASSAPPVRP
jgi:hypothetical protein